MKTFRILIGTDRTLTPETVERVAYESSARVVLSPTARREVKKAREVVIMFLKKKKRVYGITTGFGKLKDVAIDEADVEALQANLIRSHATGVGAKLSIPHVRAGLLVRAHSLAHGHSGVRLELLDFVCELLNRGITPVVPSQGSVGSSGDLAPLSHAGLIFFGEGEAWYRGKCMSGKNALKKAGMKPLPLTAKEGLAWNNGTSIMTGIAALTVARAKRLFATGDAACALTLEAACGTGDAFRPELHRIRPHPGQEHSARVIRTLVKGSKLVDSVPNRLQDSYSLRCAPQVHGATWDAFSYVEGVVAREINSVTDNPVIFHYPARVYSGGNFHGEPIAIAMDTLGIALAEIANISERRTAKLMDPATSEGLPAFLTAHAGLHSGLMIIQYTAAALVSENKVLAHPASVDSIPTSANQEDHVSIGTIAARKAWSILENSEHVLAIELIAAAQGVEFRGPRKLGRGTTKIYRALRTRVKKLEGDRILAPDIEAARALIVAGVFFTAVR
ncbi:MAG: histidine ammonia-lyase [Candidatus Jorgensenbacteria bacterium]